MSNHVISQEKYVLEDGKCPICKKNNKVESTYQRVKIIIQAFCFCLSSVGVAFVADISQIAVVDTQLIVLCLGIVFAMYYAYHNKNIQALMKNIMYFFSSFEIIFLLLNIRLFTQLSIDVIISVIIFVMLWIFIMVGVVCLSYYTTLLFRKEV
jgi:hypothetical protein